MDVYFKKVNHQLGLGAFAGRDFSPGDLVLRATGQEIDHQTMFSVQIGWNRHLEVDPPTKYLNHSCDPNLGVRSGPDGWPVFYALRSIACDEQLSFDYAMTEYRHYPRQDPALDFDLTCYCGSKDCRGRLGYYSELSQALKDKYQGYILDYLLQSDPEESVGVTHER